MKLRLVMFIKKTIELWIKRLQSFWAFIERIESKEKTNKYYQDKEAFVDHLYRALRKQGCMIERHAPEGINPDNTHLQPFDEIHFKKTDCIDFLTEEDLAKLEKEVESGRGTKYLTKAQERY